MPCTVMMVLMETKPGKTFFKQFFEYILLAHVTTIYHWNSEYFVHILLFTHIYYLTEMSRHYPIYIYLLNVVNILYGPCGHYIPTLKLQTTIWISGLVERHIILWLAKKPGCLWKFSPGRYLPSLMFCTAQDGTGTIRTAILFSVRSLTFSVTLPAHHWNVLQVTYMMCSPYLRLDCCLRCRSSYICNRQ